jgi:hypothetical protein
MDNPTAAIVSTAASAFINHRAPLFFFSFPHCRTTHETTLIDILTLVAQPDTLQLR